MKFLALYLVIIFVTFSVSCSSGDDAGTEEVVIVDDGYKSDSKEEVFIDDRALTDENGSFTARVSSQERTRIAGDGSKITTMYDGFGNKTETRFFDNHPLLLNIIVRTSVKGEKQIFIFGQNGKAKDMSPDMASKVLTAPANELATAAGITEGRKIKEMSIGNQQINKPLTPLPSSAFPVRTPQPIQTPAAADEPVDAEPTPTAAPETSDSNQKPPKNNGDSILSMK